jgi:hypothetical protein
VSGSPGKPERKRLASYFIIKTERKHQAVFLFGVMASSASRTQSRRKNIIKQLSENPKTSEFRHASANGWRLSRLAASAFHLPF